MKMKIALGIMIAVLMMLSTGCVMDEGDPSDSKLPWSKPASWEGQTLGIPM